MTCPTCGYSLSLAELSVVGLQKEVTVLFRPSSFPAGRVDTARLAFAGILRYLRSRMGLWCERAAPHQSDALFRLLSYQRSFRGGRS